VSAPQLLDVSIRRHPGHGSWFLVTTSNRGLAVVPFLRNKEELTAWLQAMKHRIRRVDVASAYAKDESIRGAIATALAD